MKKDKVNVAISATAHKLLLDNKKKTGVEVSFMADMIILQHFKKSKT